MGGLRRSLMSALRCEEKASIAAPHVCVGEGKASYKEDSTQVGDILIRLGGTKHHIKLALGSYFLARSCPQIYVL